jgi:preprotein translocase subunit YajC
MEFLFPLLILLLFIPILLSGRKQRRLMQEQQQLQSSLEVGDVVMTTSGLRGTVVDASYEDTVDIEIADDVVTTWLRAAVREKIAVPADGVDETPADDLIGSAPASDAVTGADTTADTTVDTTAGTPSLTKDTRPDADGSTRG